jgi:hypothetical protein
MPDKPPAPPQPIQPVVPNADRLTSLDAELRDAARQAPPPGDGLIEGFNVKELSEETERKIDAIEMLGEEKAAGFEGPAASQISPGMRYLHASRTIHQLVSDRNRAVGIFLAVAGLLWTASAAVMNAHDNGSYIIPLASVQRWCMPFTFAVMTVLAVMVAFLLIRTRVGLIYEVAKMNVLLGLPVGRVQRIQPLSIFFILQAMVSLGGGCSAGLLVAHFFWLEQVGHPVILSTLVGAIVAIALMVLYIVAVLHTTADDKLWKSAK